MPSASSASGSGSRKGGSLSGSEKKIYQAVLASPNSTMTQDEVLSKLKEIDTNELLGCLNSLLRKSLFVVQHGEKGLQYVASSKSEASMLGSMDPDEALVFRHIKDSNTEGIWTKMLKGRTGLHQTVMLKALKSLEGKGQIKSVKSVKNPTRKIYMLSHLTPSVELSGGPWYTDNELDTAFIAGLSNVCFQFIQDATWPPGHREGNRRLYPSAYTKYLPTATRILEHLQKKAVTSVKLAVSDIQDLLETMVYDEKIEKVPILGGAASGERPPMRQAGPSSSGGGDWGRDDSVEPPKSRRGKRGDDGDDRRNGSSKSGRKSDKSKGSSKGSSKRSSKSSRRKARHSDDSDVSEDESDGSASESEHSDEESASGSGSDSGSASESDSGSADGGSRRSGKRKRSSSRRSSSGKKHTSSKRRKKSSSRSSSRSSQSRKSRSKARGRRRHDGSSSDASTASGSDTGSGSEEEDESSGSEPEDRKVRSSKSNSKKAKSRVLTPEDDGDEDDDEGADLGAHDVRMDASLYVYRALAPAYAQQGFTETPCARCPVFDFCRPGGPVNASCVYYGDWIEGGLADDEDDDEESGSDGGEGQ